MISKLFTTLIAILLSAIGLIAALVTNLASTPNDGLQNNLFPVTSVTSPSEVTPSDAINTSVDSVANESSSPAEDTKDTDNTALGDITQNVVNNMGKLISNSLLKLVSGEEDVSDNRRVGGGGLIPEETISTEPAFGTVGAIGDDSQAPSQNANSSTSALEIFAAQGDFATKSFKKNKDKYVSPEGLPAEFDLALILSIIGGRNDRGDIVSSYSSFLQSIQSKLSGKSKDEQSEILFSEGKYYLMKFFTSTQTSLQESKKLSKEADMQIVNKFSEKVDMIVTSLNNNDITSYKKNVNDLPNIIVPGSVPGAVPVTTSTTTDTTNTTTGTISATIDATITYIDTDQPDTLVPSDSTDQPDTLVPSDSTDQPDTLVPSDSTDQPDTLVPSDSTDQPDTLVPSDSTDQPDTLVPSDSTDQPDTLVPSDSTDQPDTSVPEGKGPSKKGSKGPKGPKGPKGTSKKGSPEGIPPGGTEGTPPGSTEGTPPGTPSGAPSKVQIFHSPLVVYFDDYSYSKKLSGDFISFDFNSDGNNESMPFVAAGSGFLAIDINSDGKISNGNELFGPKTDDGFVELAAYDINNDNIINANDNVYSKLLVWSKDNSNNDILRSLSDCGIDAINLYNISYFKRGQYDIFSKDAQLGYVLSRSSILWNDEKTGIIEDLMLRITY